MKIETHYSQMIISHHELLIKEGRLRLFWIEKMKKEKLDIKDINVSKQISILPLDFTLQDLQSEIRQNILHISDDTTLTKYFHYLIKLYWTMKETCKKADNDKIKLKKLKRYKEWPVINFLNSTSKYNTEDELLGHCYYLLSAPLFNSIEIFCILREEFRFDLEKWKEYIADKKGVPSYKDVEIFVNSSNNNLPEFENNGEEKAKDKLTTKQQVNLLHLLGVFNLPAIQNLTEQKRGILFGHLLNRNHKNTEDTIRNRFVPLSEKMQKPVLDLLKELGIEKLEKL